MKKIPVLDTIRFAYGFTFGHLGAIIGLIWLPMVIATVGGYFVLAEYYTALPAALQAGNPAAIGQPVLIVMAWAFVSLLLYAMMYSAVTKQALGIRQGPALIYFSFGGTELRVFAAMLGLFAITIVFTVAYVVVDLLALAGIKLAVGQLPATALAAVSGAVALVLLIALAYALIRLSFLLIPATVAEDRIGLGRAWELARGNVWRIVAVGLATVLPLLLMLLAAEVAIVGPEFFLRHATAPAQDAAARMRESVDQMKTMFQHLPVLSALSFLLAPLVAGLTMAPSAFAYRALTAPGER